MLNSDQLYALVQEMVETRLSDERERLIDILSGLVSGPRADALNVALILAGILADDMGDDPELGFHRVEVEHEDGTSGSVDELPPYVAILLQMVVALANGERRTAMDLFLGYVGKEGSKALSFLVFALNQVMHQNELCPFCNLSEGGLESWRG